MKTKFLFLFLLSVLLIYNCKSKKSGSHNEPRSVDSSTEAVEPMSEEESEDEESTAPPKLPDLVIWSGSLSPGGFVSPGTKCTFTFEVRNIGLENYAGAIMVGGPGIAAKGFSGLDKGETKEAVVHFTAHSRGAKYELRFTVDPDNVITESDESNNESQLYIIQTTH